MTKTSLSVFKEFKGGIESLRRSRRVLLSSCQVKSSNFRIRFQFQNASILNKEQKKGALEQSGCQESKVASNLKKELTKKGTLMQPGCQ